jgi:hypothetical protein
MISANEVIAYLKEKVAETHVQTTKLIQKNRQKSAVIIKGNPAFVKGNPAAEKFYNSVADLARQKGYTVNFDKGEPLTTPAKADLWIGHSRGVDRLKYAPKGTKTLALGALGGVNHPMDRAMYPGQVPNIFHYTMNRQMRDQILNALN